MPELTEFLLHAQPSESAVFESPHESLMDLIRSPRIFSGRLARLAKGTIRVLLVMPWLWCSYGAAAEAQEWWFTAEPGARAGRGTETEPFRAASAEEFDRHMARIPANTTIILGPGTFATQGTGAFRLKNGQRMLGSGIGKTIIQLNPPPKNTALAVVLGTEGDECEDVVVQDLTVDGNYQAVWGPITVQGVNLAGHFQTLRRVEVIGAAGWAQECFALGIFASTRPSSGNVVESCVVRDYRGGWCTAIGLVNNSTLADPTNPNPYFTSGIIRNNTVDLQGASFPRGGGCAYGGGGLNGASFSGNTSRGAVLGFNFDTTRMLNTTIENNTFENCTFVGINVRSNRPGDTVQNLTIRSNSISLAPPPGQTSCFAIAAGGDASAPAVGITISDNRFALVNPGTTQAVGLQLFGWQGGAAISGNSFAAGFNQNLQPGPVYTLGTNTPALKAP